jgi:hypothetical protein
MQLIEEEILSSMQWVRSVYVDLLGEKFEIIYWRSFDENIQFEQRELTMVECNGQAIEASNPIWLEIQHEIQN